MNITYPFDANTLLRKKKSLLRELSAQQGLLEKRIAILGGSTTDEVVAMLELCLLSRGIKPVFYQSAYNQYFSEALQPETGLQQFQPELVYIHTSHVNINTWPCITSSEADAQLLLQHQLAHFTAAWDGIRQHLNCPVLQNNFDEPWHRPLGNLDGIDYRGKSRFIARLNEAFADAAQRRHDLYIHDIHYLSARIGIDHWFNPRQWHLYKHAMDMEATVHLAWNLSALIAGLFGLTKKCLVLDLDNTLWGGVIGDDGIEGISIGTHSAEAEAYSEFQQYFLSLKQRGILLAVCSKNDEANARSGFAHPASILKPDDFSAFIANWENKPDNIRTIAEQLNIGLDSLVFFDDNPAERDFVRQQLPSVSVLDAGNDVASFINIIDKSGMFETLTLSDNDLKRARQYQENHDRQSHAATFNQYDDFLRSLAMQATIEPFHSKNLERITQLTNKTNQFNLTTRRCTITEITHMAESSDYITLSGQLTDKYGDNGLVSVIAGKIAGDTLKIDLWLMSCRVLKRGLEFAMFQALCEQASQRALVSITGYFRPTDKNRMVETLYKTLGFQLISSEQGQSVWQLTLSQTTPKTTPEHFIQRTAAQEHTGNST
ncbi:MAG TPA: HAD-IIIC family phosphatase [Pseudomonadales bacterium]|nr:HAD-IIIC family phosphatase [Pseudomonadales bacterium]